MALVSISSIRIIAADIKLAHSVFALPFALLAAFLAGVTADGAIHWGRFGGQLALVVLAMFFARTAAMLANRILDARLDAGNPRTSSRAIPSGRVSLAGGIAAWSLSAIGFLVACLLFGLLYANWWPILLGAPVLAWICLYGLAKRFTQFCHFWLGSSLALSPVAAALAVDPASLGTPTIWLLAVMVLFWVAGFDVIYALQDVEVDRRDGLHSMPARMGVGGALGVSSVLHVLAVAALFGVVFTDARIGTLMLWASILVAVLLVYEHMTVRRWGTTRIALAFFTLNGVVSCLIGVAGILDVTLG